MSRDCLFLGYQEDVAPLLRGDRRDRPAVRERGHAGERDRGARRRRPVVATRVGGVPDVVRDGVDGFLVAAATSTRSPPARRLAADPELRRQMGEAVQKKTTVEGSDVVPVRQGHRGDRLEKSGALDLHDDPADHAGALEAAERELRRARVPGDVLAPALAVGEDREAVLARTEGVRDAGRRGAGDDRPGADRDLLGHLAVEVVERECAVAGEHHELREESAAKSDALDVLRLESAEKSYALAQVAEGLAFYAGLDPDAYADADLRGVARSVREGLARLRDYLARPGVIRRTTVYPPTVVMAPPAGRGEALPPPPPASDPAPDPTQKDRPDDDDGAILPAAPGGRLLEATGGGSRSPGDTFWFEDLVELSLDELTVEALRWHHPFTGPEPAIDSRGRIIYAREAFADRGEAERAFADHLRGRIPQVRGRQAQVPRQVGGDGRGRPIGHGSRARRRLTP